MDDQEHATGLPRQRRRITERAVLWALLTLLIVIPHGTAKAEIRAQARIGSANHHESRFHISLGMTICADLGKGLQLGVGVTRLIENSDEETGVDLLLAKAVAGYWLRLSIGLAVIDLRNPIHISNPPIYEAIPEAGHFVSAEIARRLTDGIALQIRYQWNTADSATHERGYPRRRISIGVEASL